MTKPPNVDRRGFAIKLKTLSVHCPYPLPCRLTCSTKNALQHSHIVRMLNDVNFAKKEGGDGVEGVAGVDLCPASLEKDIDAMNDFVYQKVRNELQSLCGDIERRSRRDVDLCG